MPMEKPWQQSGPQSCRAEQQPPRQCTDPALTSLLLSLHLPDHWRVCQLSNRRASEKRQTARALAATSLWVSAFSVNELGPVLDAIGT